MELMKQKVIIYKVKEEHMNQKIKPEEIDRSHRLGNPKKSIKAKPQPILVKYVRCNTRTFKRKRDKCDGKFNCKEDQDVRGYRGTAWICECIVTR